MTNYAGDPALTEFLSGVWQRASSLVASGPFGPEQRALLEASLQYHRQRMRGNPFADPLVFFYLVVRAQSGLLGERSEWLGAVCVLYIIALDLLDDVQDADLSGKPHEAAGAAVAINSGLTLFVLALEALQQALAAESDASRWSAFLRVLTRIALAASVGQHADLTQAAQTAREVLSVHRGKGSSIGLVIECAAIYAGADAAALARYRQVAEAMAVLLQLVGDVRDLFGKAKSPDLMAAKSSYPLMAFTESATDAQREEYERVGREGWSDLARIRRLLYASGAIRRTAEAVEAERRTIHAALGAMGGSHPALRTWVWVVDGLAAQLYTPPWLPSSESLLRPQGPWLRRIDELASRFRQEVAPFHPPVLPRLVPWAYPHWEYDRLRRTIFFPDLDTQAEPVLAQMASWTGAQEVGWLRAALEQLAPLVLAHELFHYWRHVAGRLTTDNWLEEWIANRLAVAYARRFHPDLLGATRQVVDQLLSALAGGWSDRCQEVLEALDRQGGPPRATRGYGVTPSEMALIQLAMASRLLDHAEDLEQLIRAELGPQSQVGPAPSGARA
ncbi:MAG: polyprenyl synthetase family protein [Firmicutes bacterium]|nr:polyprenyl synthetase family protein [Bacillota bacterium]